MKLRNKKTGEIWNIPKERNLAVQEDDISFFAELGTNGKLFSYHSLAELNEEWEDCEPTEPLIKDEKIRRVVRAWAEVEGETQVQVTHCREHILVIWSATKDHGNIDFDCDIEPFDEGSYTITELCGENEE